MASVEAVDSSGTSPYCHQQAFDYCLQPGLIAVVVGAATVADAVVVVVEEPCVVVAVVDPFAIEPHYWGKRS